MKHPRSLTLKLKSTPIEVKNYLNELEKENASLQRSIAKYQAKNLSQQNEIKALKKARPSPSEIIIRHEKNDLHKH